MRKFKKQILLVICLLFITVTISSCNGGKKEITVASKQFTENILLSEIYSQLIEEHTDLKVIRKQNLGGTSICFPALEKKEIDIYVEYSGTAYNEILKLPDSTGMSGEEIYNISKEKLYEEHDITMFKPIGINNTFALGMLRTKAEENNITKTSELKDISSSLRFGANHIFYTRLADGYDAMADLYELDFKEALKMDTSLLYDAIEQNKLDVIVVYATDSLLKKYDMVVLEDDKELFPPYYGAPICRNDLLEENEELVEVLDLLENRITDTRMQELDYEIDVEGRTPEEVAREFIKEEGLNK
ncbi:glycine betaine ABC transporter substrate-binding protein [Miniphocaeibacter halophilus]|uniref:Glycine/betaine ABC transporter substrate-binding protein n=1 Tax=Miniphocaeibacter halophilus TaxID=2931922 RepID=A0AC61MT08_9FIRM|nr:glycine betaine ABC transporter substrate-binding protein [Miniphocaeibacter halophilus]QQK08727.1 glycine/betaine ABC transporter substrate-binding protein [Miniphocaeibacter halophilus]